MRESEARGDAEEVFRSSSNPPHSKAERSRSEEDEEKTQYFQYCFCFSENLCFDQLKEPIDSRTQGIILRFLVVQIGGGGRCNKRRSSRRRSSSNRLQNKRMLSEPKKEIIKSEIFFQHTMLAADGEEVSVGGPPDAAAYEAADAPEIVA